MSVDDRSAFEMLHPRFQEELYRMRWTELRPIQVDAIRAIVGENQHVLIAAQTAGGKTEAAFLPVLSRILDDSGVGVRALYVGPLRALINDQFRRLDALCERAEIPVHKWHGDVGVGAKRKLLRDPNGVLLITPESLESLFINHSSALPKIFGQLAHIVIDELHAFLGTERGAHLRSLLARVVTLSREQVRFIGLSATMGEPIAAWKWFCPNLPDPPRIITDDHEDREIRYVVKGYLKASTGNVEPLVPDLEAEIGDQESAADPPMADDIYQSFAGSTALVFVNSRTRLEYIADLAIRRAERERRPGIFRVHHGSLSKVEREETEDALRSGRPTTAFCSSTLELGIDVGNVSSVGQVGAPWSVSSLAQRLGRSGRRDGAPSIMRMFIEEEEPSDTSKVVDRVFPDLLQSIAMTDLFLERWCEPPDTGKLHASTLIQQIMSVVAELGGARAERLYDSLVIQGGFFATDKKVFIEILRNMSTADLIEQTDTGEIILGTRGEQIARHFEFYAAFMTDQEFRVVCQGHAIGSVASSPGLAADGFIILAGRRWRVISIDDERREILVAPSRGGRLPEFAFAPGADIHPVVRLRMREVLRGNEVATYLDLRAREMLARARFFAKELGILHQPLASDGLDVVWFPWAGSKVSRTIVGLGSHIGGFTVHEDGLALTFENTSTSELAEAYQDILQAPPEPQELARRFPLCSIEKYDRYLSNDLRALVFAQNSLDLKGALQLIRQTFSTEQGST